MALSESTVTSCTDYYIDEVISSYSYLDSTPLTTVTLLSFPAHVKWTHHFLSLTILNQNIDFLVVLNVLLPRKVGIGSAVFLIFFRVIYSSMKIVYVSFSS